MDTRIIHTNFWEDAKVLEMSPFSRYLFLYYFSNNRICHLGIFKIANKLVLLETGLEQDQIDLAKEELESYKTVRFYDDWVYVVNAQKLSNYTGPKNEAAREKELCKIPADVIEHFRSLGHQIPYQYTIDTSINHKTETITYKKENNTFITEPEEQRMMTSKEADELVSWADENVK